MVKGSFSVRVSVKNRVNIVDRDRDWVRLG